MIHFSVNFKKYKQNYFLKKICLFLKKLINFRKIKAEKKILGKCHIIINLFLKMALYNFKINNKKLILK